MKIKEKRKIEKSVTVGYKCDICGKDISKDDIYTFDSHLVEFDHIHEYEDREDWRHIYDVCSGECYIVALRRALTVLKQNLPRNINQAVIENKPVRLVKEIIKILQSKEKKNMEKYIKNDN